MQKLAGPIIALGALALLLFLWGRVVFDIFSNPGATFRVLIDYVVIPSLVLSGIIFIVYFFYKLSKPKRSH